MTLLAAVMVASAVGGERGLGRALELERELAEINAASFGRIQEIDEMRGQLGRIRSDDRELEKVARRKLHLVQKGDVLYRIGTGG